MNINSCLARQKEFFRNGTTRSYNFRAASLDRLLVTVRANEERILKALQADFAKPFAESYLSEISLVEQEIIHIRARIKRWSARQRVATPLLYFPARSYLQLEPLGQVLIIAPWNYPFQLALTPLVAAIAAGNCVMLKPSEVSRHVAELLSELLSECFVGDHVQVINGGVEVGQQLVSLPFDHIFFTGSTEIGRKVARQAANNLTPVTLELGGKSPCIIDDSVPIIDSVRRIVWAKFFNAGQSCIAPDYLLVEEKIKDLVITTVRQTIVNHYGTEPRDSNSFARIINSKHCQRLVSYLDDGCLVHGGDYDIEACYLSPTVLVDCQLTTRVMQEEIFGPILPILTFTDTDDLCQLIDSIANNPLAMYIFSRRTKTIDTVQTCIACGSSCINDALMQYGVPDLPFGGKGTSGCGRSHGRHAFLTFSHQRAVMHRLFGFDLKVRFPPYPQTLGLLRLLSRIGRLKIF